MNERERMLAEGPRVAPEPRVIGDPEPTEAPAPEPTLFASSEPAAEPGFEPEGVARPEPGRPAPNTLSLPGRRNRRTPRPWYVRFLPVIALVVIGVARNAGSRNWPVLAVEILPVVLAIVVIAVLAFRRLRASR